MASTRNPPHPSSGIISNVLGYWSREYDKFVATATGAPLPDVRVLLQVLVLR
jgi:hypothetical protein